MKILKIFSAMMIAFAFVALCGCGGGKGGGSTPASYIPYIPTENNSNNNSSNNSNNKKPWLFIVYFAADNSDIIPWQLLSLDRLEQVGSDENTDIVAFVDIGNPKQKDIPNWNLWEWKTNINWTGARGYYIQKDDKMWQFNSKVIGEYGDIDSGSKEFFSKCLKEAVIKYPAENICLFLNDHGGAYSGLMLDETSGTMMTNKEVAESIKEVEDETGSRINVLCFDACLMANVESLYEYRNVTDYILASEEETYADAFRYEDVLNSASTKSTNISVDKKISMLPKAIERIQNRYRKIEEINESEDTYSKIYPEITPKEFAQIIFDVNKENVENIEDMEIPPIYTYSLIDTSKFESLKEAIDDFAEAVINTDNTNLQKISNNLYNQFDPDTGLPLSYGQLSEDYYMYLVYDLYNMMNRILESDEITDQNVKDKAEAVQQAVTEVVIDNVNFSGNLLYSSSHGLSMFFGKQDDLTYEYSANYNELEFTKNSKWLKMVKKTAQSVSN